VCCKLVWSGSIFQYMCGYEEEKSLIGGYTCIDDTHTCYGSLTQSHGYRGQERVDAHSNERRPATLGTVNISNSQESSACPRRYAAAARVGASPPIKPTVLFDAFVAQMHMSRFQLLHTTLFLCLVFLLATDLFYPHSQTYIFLTSSYESLPSTFPDLFFLMHTAARGGADLIYD
jgi:hypothetical protein